MQNPLVETVEHELNQLGMNNARLAREFYSAKRFGNAEAVYTLGNLQIRFVRDRGDDTLSIGSTSSPDDFYVLEDVAVWMGWLSLDELLRYDTPINFDAPPPGPIIGLAKALGLIQRDFVKLNKAFGADEMMFTRASLQDIERLRIGAS